MHGSHQLHELQLGAGLQGYLYVIDGRVPINGDQMRTGDAAKVSGEATLELTTQLAAELILSMCRWSSRPSACGPASSDGSGGAALGTASVRTGGRQVVAGESSMRSCARAQLQTSIPGGSMPSVVRAVQIWLR